nr:MULTISPECIES: glycosyltransferase [Microbacterium]
MLLTTWFPTLAAPSSGIFVANDAKLLAGRHDVAVVHLASPALLSEDDLVADRSRTVQVTRIPMSTTNPLDLFRAGGRLRDRLESADILHTQAFSTLLPLARLRVPLPWVHTEHWSALSNPETLGSARLALPLLRPLLRRPDVVTGVCEYLAAPVRAHRRGPTQIVPCIVPPAAHLAALPRRPHPRLVAVGGLVERKDPVLAVDALRLIHDAGVRADLRFVGDGPLRGAVADRAARHSLTDHVSFAGVVDQAGVTAELTGADVFFLPTKGENFCVSAAEAIVQGRPVVVGANGGQREYVEELNGELVADQTPAAYAHALLRVLRRDPRPQPADIAATIGDRFSPDRVADGYDSAYAEAVALRTT